METKKVPDVMWFEFLFDKTGTFLTSHLLTPNAAPSAEQLIQQFLEKSGCISPWTKNQTAKAPQNGQELQEVSEPNNKRKEPLLLLAFHVASHLDWNLDTLQSGYPLYVQYVLLNELVKMYHKDTEDIKQTPELLKIEKKAIFPLLLYYRWIVRSIVDQSSSKLTESKTNDSSAEAKSERTEMEKLIDKIEGEETTAINVLQQAVSWKDDVNLPALPPLRSTTVNEQETSEKVETITEEGSSNKNDDNVMDTSCSEVKTVPSQSIVGQICFDLGTLHFFKGNIEKAKSLFEICSSVQCASNSFYTVDKKRLSGYYTACCSLTHCPVRENLVSSQSLMSQMEQCKYDGYKNLVSLLIKDNAEQRVPYTFRRCLEADVVRYIQQNFRADKTLPWKVCCCNTTGNLLAGRCVDPEFWKMLENSTGEQFECFIQLFVDSVTLLNEKQKSENNGILLSQLESAIACLLVGQFAQDRLKILLKSNIGKYININNLKQSLEKHERDLRSANSSFSPIALQPHKEARVDLHVQVSQLEHDLQVTSCPSQIPNILMRLLSRDRDPHKKHAKAYESALYRSYIQDLKDEIQQDLLHVLFSKSHQCLQRKDFVTAKSFLDFGYQTIQDQRKRYGNNSTFDKLSNFLAQEILVINILMAEENREKLTPDIMRRIMSNLTIGVSDYAPKPHAVETMVVYLLNVQEWHFLSDLDIRGAGAMDYKELARSIAGVCTNLTKPLLWRKMAKTMWDVVLKIFTSTVQHKRMLADGTLIDIKRDPENLPHFVKFISKIKDETCLSLIMSCLERMRSLESPNDEEEKEQKNTTMYSHLWPTSIPSASNIEFSQIGLALLETIDHSVTVHPFNPTYLKTQGDTFYENENHLNALRCYLQAGAAASDFFAVAVPKTVWDNTVYRKMIACCTAFNAHTQVAVLCQFLEPIDYALAFNAMKQTTRNDASEFYYNCIWDITLLEFVVYIHNKRGENDKKQIAVQAINQAELNSCNPPEILQNAKRTRNKKFLQILAQQYL